MNRVNGVRFDGLHSFHDLDMWFSERPDWGSPEPKLNLVEIPGADGVLDLTEANAGEVKFNNRQITLTFAAMVKAEEQERFKSRIMNTLHGKVIQQIIPDEDPDWYYTGRCAVSFANVNSWKMQIVVTVDAYPYALKTADTVFNFRSASPVSSGTKLITRSVNTEAGDPTAKSSTFLFGTKEFPTGVRFAGGTADLIISWSAGALVGVGGLTFPHLTVVDSDGHTYLLNITSDVSIDRTSGVAVTASAGSVTITQSQLSTAGIVVGDVWRIWISVAGCTVKTSAVVIEYAVPNARRLAIPVFTLKTRYPDTFHGITVMHSPSGRISSGGENDYYVPVGVARYEDIVLHHGTNVFYTEEFDLQAVTEFYISYREGKL